MDFSKLKMGENVDGDALVQQASNIWQMLDDMAEENPEAYKKFIDKQIQEGKQQMKPPEPHMCLSSRVQEGCDKCSKNDIVFVNFCAWNRIPNPADDEAPIPCMGSEPYPCVDEKGKKCTAIAIAFNPQVLENFGINSNLMQERQMLIDLALDYIQDQQKVKLSRSYTLYPAKVKCKGDPKLLQAAIMDRFKGENDQYENELDHLEKSFEPLSSLSPKGSLISQLSNISVNDNRLNQNGNNPPLILPGGNTKCDSPKKSLIQEIGGGENQVCEPEYSVMKRNDGNKPERLVLRIHLPAISSVQDCILDISQDDVHLEVEGIYMLTVKLPEKIKDVDSSAKFSKKTSSLTVTMPIQHTV